MLGQDLQTFVLNLYLLIGALIVLGVLFVFLIIAWTGTKMAITTVKRRRAERLWRKVTRRADGKPYPPSIEGTCDQCRRGSRFVYYPDGSEKGYCPACYESFWRRTEGFVEADHPMPPPAAQTQRSRSGLGRQSDP